MLNRKSITLSLTMTLTLKNVSVASRLAVVKFAANNGVHYGHMTACIGRNLLICSERFNVSVSSLLYGNFTKVQPCRIRVTQADKQTDEQTNITVLCTRIGGEVTLGPFHIRNLFRNSISK